MYVGRVDHTPFVLTHVDILDTFSGMLEDGHDDFQTSEDLYDAIGGILQGTDDSKTDDEIKNICGNLHSLMSL